MIVKKIDGVGRVVIPAEIRNTLHWKENDQLTLEVKNDSLMIKKKDENSCKLCQSTERLHRIDENWLCEKCITKIHDAW